MEFKNSFFFYNSCSNKIFPFQIQILILLLFLISYAFFTKTIQFLPNL